MLVLLPPSEGKAAPRRGRPVAPGALAFPALADRREALLDALAALSTGPPEGALAALGMSAGQAHTLGRNAGLRTAPAARASTVYTGVLFERLRLAELPKRARDRVLIFSGLWGVVRPDDRIPAYKLPMDARLPGVGALAAFWRPALRGALPDGGLVVDLRSGPYAAAWVPGAAKVVAVRAFTEEHGRRTAVSHMVKATRGDVARVLLERSPPPRTPDAVADHVAAAGHRVELVPSRTGWTLDVIRSP